jgi:hypothetical protein
MASTSRRIGSSVHERARQLERLAHAGLSTRPCSLGISHAASDASAGSVYGLGRLPTKTTFVEELLNVFGSNVEVVSEAVLES